MISFGHAWISLPKIGKSTSSRSATAVFNNDYVVLVFLLLTLNIFYTPFSSVSIADFEQVNINWEIYQKILCT